MVIQVTFVIPGTIPGREVFDLVLAIEKASGCRLAVCMKGDVFAFYPADSEVVGTAGGAAVTPKYASGDFEEGCPAGA